MSFASLGSWVGAQAVLASDPAQLLPAREQMAFTLGFHIILVPFGVAFTFLMMIANYRGIRRGDSDALLLAERWSKVAAVLLCVPSLFLLYVLQQRGRLEGA
jgi:cytochrome bd ubiquinol oxidase subunit I